MNRLLLLLGLLAPTTASAVGVVPPIIRAEKPDQSADAPTADEDPLKTIERITKNARAVGDRLQNEDSGNDTQKAQDQLLKDIDSLLKPPPPMGGGGGGGPPPPPMGGGGGGAGGSPPPPMGGGGGGGGSDSKPMGGDGGGTSKRQRGDRQEESQGSGQNKKEPMGAGGQEKKEPMGDGAKLDPNQPPMPGGGDGSGKDGQGAAGDGGKKHTPNLPLDDPFTRRVWGHLPEKVRQQAMQSYREQFMPRYSEMLKQYYSTLNEKQSPNPSK